MNTLEWVRVCVRCNEFALACMHADAYARHWLNLLLKFISWFSWRFFAIFFFICKMRKNAVFNSFCLPARECYEIAPWRLVVGGCRSQAVESRMPTRRLLLALDCWLAGGVHESHSQALLMLASTSKHLEMKSLLHSQRCDGGTTAQPAPAVKAHTNAPPLRRKSLLLPHAVALPLSSSSSSLTSLQ